VFERILGIILPVFLVIALANLASLVFVPLALAIAL
jgi:hypothetical protein